MTCVPKEIITENDIISNRFLYINNYTVIESYNDITSEYIYYIGSDCEYMQFETSNLIPIPFNFFNDSYLGFRSSGNYSRLKYNENDPVNTYTLVSFEDYNVNDLWSMSGDTAYQFTREYVDGEYFRFINRYTPTVVGVDDKESIIIFPDETNIIRRRMAEEGSVISFNHRYRSPRFQYAFKLQ